MAVPNLRVVWAGVAVFALGYLGAAVAGGMLAAGGGPVSLAAMVPEDAGRSPPAGGR